MLLRSRQAHAYSWRTPHTVKDNPRLHVCIETEGDWRWSEPFEIDTVGVFSRTIHHRLHSATLFIEVKQLSGMQKQVCTQLWYSTRYQNEKHSGRSTSTPMFKSMQSKNSSIDSRPHYRSDAFSTAHTKTLENDRIRKY